MQIETVAAFGHKAISFLAEFGGVAAKMQIAGRSDLSDLCADRFGQITNGIAHRAPARQIGMSGRGGVSRQGRKDGGALSGRHVSSR